jgi:hypothetical protein
MRGKKAWFPTEVKRAGWISAAPVAALVGIVVWRCWNSGSGYENWFYPSIAVTLGAVAVIVLNWKERKTLRESFQGCVAATVSLFKLLSVTVLPVAVAKSADWNPIAALTLLVMYSLAVLFWAGYSFLLCAAGACIGGAVIYGLLALLQRLKRSGSAT